MTCNATLLYIFSVLTVFLINGYVINKHVIRNYNVLLYIMEKVTSLDGGLERRSFFMAI